MLRRALIGALLACTAAWAAVAAPVPAPAAPPASLSAAHAVQPRGQRRHACRRRVGRARRHRRCHAVHRPRLLTPGVAIAAPAPTSGGVPPAPRPPPPADVTPPRFAGIQSAFACTPGPQRPGQTTPFRLSWEAARDDVTPTFRIVYDVYLATEQGGEEFSRPTWTTPPGAVSYETPGLSSHGTFYFVVRARDLAGNEDANTVELPGTDPCL